MMHSSDTNEDLRFVELLDRWQSGAFTREDEQELEALAAGDPFRKEALEGFWDHPQTDHGAVLESLQSRLREKNRRRFSIPQMLAIAAAFVLLLAAVWFFNIRQAPDFTPAIAQELPQNESGRTIPEVSSPDFSTPAPVSSQPTVAQTPTRSGAGGGGSAVLQDVDKIVIAPNAAPAEAPAMESEDVSDGLAAAEPEKKEDGAVQSPGSIIEQSTNAMPAKEYAEESAKRAKTSAPTKAKSFPTRQTQEAAPEPVMGWDAFRQFLRSNARLTDEARAHNISGIVRLRFSLDAAGQLVNMEVVRGLGYGCNDQAVNLVKSVPWKGAAGQPVTVDVSFVR